MGTDQGDIHSSTSIHFLANYAKEHNLLTTRRMEQQGSTSEKLAKRNTLYKNATVYMFGHEVPQNHAQAMGIDQKNGNTKWADSEKTERDQLFHVPIQDI